LTAPLTSTGNPEYVKELKLPQKYVEGRQ
jgi:hypothetical protein